MRPLRAFALGACACGVVAYCFSVALAVVAATSGTTVRLAVGWLLLVAVEHTDGGTTATTFGSGLAVVALVGGCANVAAGIVLRRRRGSGGIA